MGAELQALVGPGLEVRGRIDAAAGALVLADRPVLLEGRGALDGRLVSAGGLEDLVAGTIDLNAAEAGSSRGWVVCPKVLYYVIFDERVLGPAVALGESVTIPPNR